MPVLWACPAYMPLDEVLSPPPAVDLDNVWDYGEV
jgi:hypothetical protein